MFCTKCGGENQETARFCAQCGVALPPGVPGAPGAPGATGAPQKGMSTGCIVLLILGVCGMAIIPIGILVALAVPNFLEAQVRAKVSRARSDMRSVATAIESYAVDNNTYPANMNPSVTTPVSYISQIPNDPFSAPPGTKPQYFAWSVSEEDGEKKTNYLIQSAGPDATLEVLPEDLLLKTPSHPMSVLNDLTYDPTNGTTSRGDIFRFSYNPSRR